MTLADGKASELEIIEKKNTIEYYTFMNAWYVRMEKQSKDLEKYKK